MEREVLPQQQSDTEFEVFVRTNERRIRLAPCAAYGTDLGIEASAEAVFAAFDAWMEETSHGAGAAAGDFYKDPVGKDPDIVVAGLIGAADEFLAQYEG
jgi:hypothetical protein